MQELVFVDRSLPSNILPVAQEKIVGIGGRWYYENILTGKKRPFPKEDDWDDDVIDDREKKSRGLTQLSLFTAILSCSHRGSLRFTRHYINPQLNSKVRTTKKADQIYVYACVKPRYKKCRGCPREFELTYVEAERVIVENVKLEPKGI
jgi:hypothetical protein